MHPLPPGGRQRARAPPAAVLAAERGGRAGSVSSLPRSRCSAGARPQRDSPLRTASPTGGAGRRQSRRRGGSREPRRRGRGSLGGGTAPGDGAEPRRPRWLAGGAGPARRQGSAEGGEQRTDAPPTRFYFPFRRHLPRRAARAGERRDIYLFIFVKGGEDLRGEDAPAGGEEGTEAAPSREEAAAGRRSPRGGEAGAELCLTSPRLARRAAPPPLPPRRPWPPEAPAAARPHDGLNRHLHPVHRRVPALRGAREVSTEPAGRAPPLGTGELGREEGSGDTEGSVPGGSHGRGPLHRC